VEDIINGMFRSTDSKNQKDQQFAGVRHVGDRDSCHLTLMMSREKPFFKRCLEMKSTWVSSLFISIEVARNLTLN